MNKSAGFIPADSIGRPSFFDLDFFTDNVLNGKPRLFQRLRCLPVDASPGGKDHRAELFIQQFKGILSNSIQSIPVDLQLPQIPAAPEGTDTYGQRAAGAQVNLS